MVLSRFNKRCELLKGNSGRQTAADNQQRAWCNLQDLLLNLLQFIFMERRAGHDKSILFAAGIDVDVKVLAGPLVRIDTLNRNILLLEQGDQVLAGGTTGREDGGSSASEKGNCAGNVNAAAAGLKHRGTAAQFTFRIDLWRLGGAVE